MDGANDAAASTSEPAKTEEQPAAEPVPASDGGAEQPTPAETASVNGAGAEGEQAANAAPAESASGAAATDTKLVPEQAATAAPQQDARVDWVQVTGLGNEPNLETVAEAFGKHGKVVELFAQDGDPPSVLVRMAGDSGASTEEAQKEDSALCVDGAVKNLHDAEIGGSKVSVVKAPELAQVFCGNVQVETTEEDLRGLFSKCGAIERVVVMQRKEGGLGLGYGFVEFGSAAEARRAIDALNLQAYKERQLRVDHSDCRSPSSKLSRILFVDMLPRGFGDPDKLRTLFSSRGQLVDCHLAKGPGGVPRGFAFVEFAEHESALKAFEELNGHTMEGTEQAIRVSFGNPASWNHWKVRSARLQANRGRGQFIPGRGGGGMGMMGQFGRGGMPMGSPDRGRGGGMAFGGPAGPGMMGRGAMGPGGLMGRGMPPAAMMMNMMAAMGRAAKMARGGMAGGPPGMPGRGMPGPGGVPGVVPGVMPGGGRGMPGGWGDRGRGVAEGGPTPGAWGDRRAEYQQQLQQTQSQQSAYGAPPAAAPQAPGGFTPQAPQGYGQAAAQAQYGQAPAQPQQQYGQPQQPAAQYGAAQYGQAGQAQYGQAGGAGAAQAQGGYVFNQQTQQYQWDPQQPAQQQQEYDPYAAYSQQQQPPAQQQQQQQPAGYSYNPQTQQYQYDQAAYQQQQPEQPAQYGQPAAYQQAQQPQYGQPQQYGQYDQQQNYQQQQSAYQYTQQPAQYGQPAGSEPAFGAYGGARTSSQYDAASYGQGDPKRPRY